MVHGPLIAILSLAAFQHAHPQARVTHMAYRGVRPLISPTSFDVAGRITEAGSTDY